MDLFLLSFVHFLVHFCGNDLSFGLAFPATNYAAGRPAGILGAEAEFQKRGRTAST
jgi:hypothetical protein